MRVVAVFLILLLNQAVFAVTSEELEKAIQIPVEKYQLANGLTVLLHPDNTIPAVSVQTWYRVGSKDEVEGRTGLAHFFEHMMFKGTKKYPKDTWGAFLNAKGTEHNAFTSNDYTGYYINAPAEHLQLLLDIESDRMRQLLLELPEVASEREVVKEERRMRYEDNIDGGIREKMTALMFEKLPYKWLPIGSMVDLNAASMDDLHKFYKTYYSPNNAVLVVAGDFDLKQTKEWIQNYFGVLPKEEIKRPQIVQEVAQTKARRAVIEREAQAPTVAIGYRLPDLKNPDLYALDLLSIILGQGQSSRLYRQLVYKDELALNVSSYSYGQALAGQFVIYASLKPKVNPDKVLNLIDKQVAVLRSKLIDQKELDKARNIFLKDYVDGLKRISGRARMLANYEILLGDYRRIFSDLAEYQKVTPEDIRRVAQSYLKSEQRNIVIVLPRSSGGKK